MRPAERTVTRRSGHRLRTLMRRFAIRAPVPAWPASTSSALGRPAPVRPQRRKTGCLVTRNGVPCGGVGAGSASEVGTPSSVASKVRAQPLTVRASASVTRPTRIVERITHLPGKKGRAAPVGAARPKATASYMPMGAFNATCAPTPMMPRVAPPSFWESYARCSPIIPKPRFAPMTQPKFDWVLKPDALFQRSPRERYGSMLRPGVGTFTLMPAPATIMVVLGCVMRPEVTALEVPAPSWKFIATGIRLPPITLNCAVPPTDVVLLLYPSGFQFDRPAVRLILARPTVARAPYAVPLPPFVFGKPKSPSIVTPVPPFGLFQTGIPA